MLALLWERNQKGVLYVPGLSVDRVRDTYRGESKTDARDARVIADQAWMRSELDELKPGEQEITELQLLLARRCDLITDQSRTITRLREALLSLFPAPERALDLNSKGSLILLTHYQTPAKLRRAGQRRVAAYLRNHGVKGSANVAHKALGPAGSQSVILPAQDVASHIVALEAGIGDALTYLSFPGSHHAKLRTTHMLERLFKEVKRRTRVVGIFPDETSASTLAMEIALRGTEEWRSGATSRRTLSRQQRNQTHNIRDIDPK